MFSLLKKIITPEHLLYLFIFLLPFQTRWIFLDAENSFQDLSLYVFDIVLVAIYVLLIPRFRRFRHTHPSAVVRFFFRFTIVVVFLFIIWLLLSTTWSVHANTTLYWALRMLLGAGLILVIRYTHFSLTHSAWAFTLSMLIPSLTGIAQFFLQDDIFTTALLGTAAHDPSVLGTSVVETLNGRWLRAYGILPHPNVLGGMSVLALLSTSYLISRVSLVVSITAIIQRLFLAGSMIVFLTALYFSFSRSAWLALIAVILVWGITQIRRLFKRISLLHFLILPSLLALTLITALYGSLVVTRFSFNSRLEIQSISQRTQNIENASILFQHQPIIGSGIGTYTRVDQSRVLDSRLTEPVHNVVLLGFVEIGVIGMMLFFFSAISAISTSLAYTYNSRDRQQNTEQRLQMRQSIVVVVVTLMVLSSFDHYFWTLPSMVYITWLTVALLVNPKKTLVSFSFRDKRLKPATIFTH